MTNIYMTNVVMLLYKVDRQPYLQGIRGVISTGHEVEKRRKETGC